MRSFWVGPCFILQESTASMIQSRPKLKLTRPKEPEFETAQRVRAVRVKSSAELEEEMLAKLPKFKARSVNKKVSLSHCLVSIPQENLLIILMKFITSPRYLRHLHFLHCPEVLRSHLNLR